MRERRFTFVRHASTVYNGLRLLNGDARVPVPLDAAGRVAAAALAAVARALPVRPRAAHALRAHARDTEHPARPPPRVPVAVEPSFDDIDVGAFEGRDIEAYRAWRALHPPSERVPGGESRLDALERYADGCARLLGRHDASRVLLVVHDVPMRFLRNAMLRADPLDGPVRTIANLEVLTASEAQLGAALAVMRRRLARLPPV